MNRRTFLKITSLGSVSIVAACTSKPEKTFYALIEASSDGVTGEAAWYATTYRECPAGCGIVAKNREGRVVKVEGNPLHPVNKGKLCMRGQAALQGIYSPDRIKIPAIRPHEEEILIATPADELKSPFSQEDLMTPGQGKSLYLTYCAQCHGKPYDGNGRIG